MLIEYSLKFCLACSGNFDFVIYFYNFIIKA